MKKVVLMSSLSKSEDCVNVDHIENGMKGNTYVIAAPVSGILQISKQIGDLLAPGEVFGSIETTSITVELDLPGTRSGRIVDIFFSNGSHIEKGDTFIEIENVD